MATIIHVQFGLPDIGVDTALLQIGKKQYFTPCWLWQELRPDVYGEPGGGIRRMIEDFGLRQYRPHPCEDEALRNIERRAKALWLFFARPSSRRQRRILTQVERQTLMLERTCIIKHPELKGILRLKWIADELDKIAGYPYSTYTPRRIQDILETAAEALLAADDEAERKHTAKNVREWTTAVAQLAAEVSDDNGLAMAA